MFRRFTILSVALAVIAGLASVQQASAQTVPHKERTDGVILVSEFDSPTLASQEWSAVGQATHMGRYTEVGSHKADLATGEILDGEFTSTAADGSTISGIYYGNFTVNGDGSVSYQVVAEWLEGTGRFEGVTGIGDVSALATGVTPGSTFHFDANGVWDLP